MHNAQALRFCWRSFMARYIYEGPVKLFGQIVQRNWVGETMAVSEAKARSNLAYRWKREHKKTAASAVTLPGKLTTY